jgi:hypothetical protein
MEDMTKKTWSVVLLCVLAVLLIVLCAVGFKIQKSLETLEHADASNGVIPGAGMLTLVYANLSLYFGFLMTMLMISFVGFLISCLNISIAPDRVIKGFSVGFLVLYSIPAVLVIVMIAGVILF